VPKDQALLITAALVALVWANGPWSPVYEQVP
jgi:hypothetical protein